MNYIVENFKADVSGLKAYLGIPSNYIILESKAIVDIEYEAEIESRSWGIKNIIAYATRVKGTIEYSVDHDEEDKREGTIDIYVMLSSADWKLESNIKPSLEGELLMITHCEIDLEKKTINVW